MKLFTAASTCLEHDYEEVMTNYALRAVATDRYNLANILHAFDNALRSTEINGRKAVDQ